jgi:hypothetical protein
MAETPWAVRISDFHFIAHYRAITKGIMTSTQWRQPSIRVCASCLPANLIVPV